MYAETEILFPYFQSLAQEAQQLEDFCNSHSASPSLTSAISEYDIGGEGDLFKAPEPIIEEPLGSIDPMASAISMSMMSCVEDVISPQGFKQSDIESFQNEQLLSEVFYECKKDLDMKFPDGLVEEESLLPGSQFQKSLSSGCLSSMEWMSGSSVRPSFLDFADMDFGSVDGMRRAYSEGDIKTLGDGNGNTNTNNNHSSSFMQPSIISNRASKQREEMLSRYRNKKSKRNFGRKIKYACRKALADSQPRIRGRFAKTEESDIPKRQCLSSN